MQIADRPRQPQRTCIGCRRVTSVDALWRCSLPANGAAAISRNAPGRGAWLCQASHACFEAARRRRAFSRAWRRPVDDAALAPLEGLFTEAFEAASVDVKDLQAAGSRPGWPAPIRKG